MTADSRLLPRSTAAATGGLPLATAMALSFLGDRMDCGELTVTMGGERRVFTADLPGPRATMRLHRPRALRRLLTGGAVGLGEAYMDGDFDSPDLTALLELGDRNSSMPEGGWLTRWALRLHHRLRDNTRLGSRRNIAAHYDLGNAFYARWLDPGMTYSAALFRTGSESLEQAQTAKYRALADDLGLTPGMTVLEIGCGWGGFAEIAARDYGARVLGLTLSAEQHAWATRRMAEAGLSDRVEIRMQDYRDVTGSFDRIASIEMIEAVGERWWPTYFATLRDRLKPGGKAGLQAITIANDRFAGYRAGCDFIQRHVFPGGMLPSPAVLDRQAATAGLSLATTRRFGMDYERTLQHWEDAFQAAWPDIQPLGFDTRFKRLWEFYLAYCRAGFRTGAIDVCHLLLARD